MRAFMRSIVAAALTVALAGPALAEVQEVHMARQPGLVYLPLMIMEQNHLIEKQAQQHGLGYVKTTWTTFNSGGAAVDALLSGNVDFITSGITNLLVAWSATNGGVKGVGGAGAVPMLLLTRNPNVKTLKDFTSADKIAVPTVRVSTQATMLQMAAEKEYGPSQTHKFDPITVALGHPDAYIALQSGRSEVDSHFSLPPYQDLEQRIPGVHVVASSIDIAGGPVSNGVVFATVKFHDANPKVAHAVLAALDEAVRLINTNKRAAALIYLQQTHDKLALDDVIKILSQPNFVYSLAPQRSLKVAELMYRAGTIKNKPASWQEYFFPDVHGKRGS